MLLSLPGEVLIYILRYAARFEGAFDASIRRGAVCKDFYRTVREWIRLCETGHYYAFPTIPGEIQKQSRLTVADRLCKRWSGDYADVDIVQYTFSNLSVGAFEDFSYMAARNRMFGKRDIVVNDHDVASAHYILSMARAPSVESTSPASDILRRRR